MIVKFSTPDAVPWADGPQLVKWEFLRSKLLRFSYVEEQWWVESWDNSQKVEVWRKSNYTCTTSPWVWTAIWWVFYGGPDADRLFQALIRFQSPCDSVYSRHSLSLRNIVTTDWKFVRWRLLPRLSNSLSLYHENWRLGLPTAVLTYVDNNVGSLPTNSGQLPGWSCQ